MNAKSAFLFLSIFFSAWAVNAQNKVCKIWWNQEKTSHVKVFLATDGKYYGKIIWLQDSVENGKPKTDKENPDAAKRNRPIIGMQFLSGLEKKSETEYGNGKIYDPKNGKTYDCKITVIDDKHLDLRGYVMGMPFLGRTSNWTLVE